MKSGEKIALAGVAISAIGVLVYYILGKSSGSSLGVGTTSPYGSSNSQIPNETFNFNFPSLSTGQLGQSGEQPIIPSTQNSSGVGNVMEMIRTNSIPVDFAHAIAQQNATPTVNPFTGKTWSSPQVAIQNFNKALIQ